MRRLSVSATIGLALFSTFGTAKAQAPTSPHSGAVNAIFKQYDNKTGPGCSVAVIDGGKVILNRSFGMADPALGVPMTSNTTFWIPYSEARLFVALGVAMLSREGKITLDDPVRRHVPQVPAYAERVTVRHLLHHTSGLADYGVLAGPGYDLGDRMPEDEFFRMITRWGGLASEPGRTEQYSNTDYALLKILVERVSGKSLHDYLSERIFRPLGMNSTRVGFDQDKVVPNHALFHDTLSRAMGMRRLLRYRVSPVGGIALTTSLNDIVRLDRELREGGLGIPELIEQLKPGALNSRSSQGGGDLLFGIYPRTDRGVPMIEYRGVGEYIYLVQVPSKKLSVATLCNSYDKMWSFGPDVAALFAGAKTVPPTAEAASQVTKRPPNLPKDLSAVAVSAQELEQLVGEYGSGDRLNTVDVALTNGTLIMRPRGRPALPPLKPLGSNMFTLELPGSTVVLDFKPEGGDMVMSSWDVAANEPANVDLRRILNWRPTADVVRSYSGTYVGDKVDITLYVRADGDKLLMAASGMEESSLIPQKKADEFRLPDTYWARFERGADGKVNGLTLDAVRVKGMRFSRRP